MGCRKIRPTRIGICRVYPLEREKKNAEDPAVAGFRQTKRNSGSVRYLP